MKRPNKSSNEFRYKSLVKDGKSSDKATNTKGKRRRKTYEQQKSTLRQGSNSSHQINPNKNMEMDDVSILIKCESSPEQLEADMLYQGISEVLKSIMFLIETEIYPGTIKDVDFRLIGRFLTNIQCTLLERD
ncbi:unnamed protein product [Schistosoma curassoni]|uniref:HORMA domain-containing protein n=1 Tax=Schistosoma curassoni TaxID=6186 RepID=A0A183KHH2_9TREM|nr:unnamed protein product [Schistosoma curassoni]